jgi:ubiquinone/menaquinone biosynthesis C-methylase UbiE
MPDGETSDAPRHGRTRVTIELLDSPRALLDYGCGNGKFASKVAQLIGTSVDACDVNSAAIDKARLEPGVRAHLISAETPHVPIEAGQLDAVTCCDVIEHMGEDVRRSALKEMLRVLADDGILVVTTPHKGLFAFADPENFKFHVPRLHRLVYQTLHGRERYERRYGGKRFGNYSGGDERHRHFSTAELSDILRDAGFEIEAVRYYTLIYPFARTVLWLTQGAKKRLPASSRALQNWSDRLLLLCWRLYMWDADLECGRASCSIAVRARKALA